MPEITEAMDRERMQAPKKTCTGFRRLRSHWDAQGRRKTAKPRNHCGHKGRSPWRKDGEGFCTICSGSASMVAHTYAATLPLTHAFTLAHIQSCTFMYHT